MRNEEMENLMGHETQGYEMVESSSSNGTVIDLMIASISELEPEEESD